MVNAKAGHGDLGRPVDQAAIQFVLDQFAALEKK